MERTVDLDLGVHELMERLLDAIRVGLQLHDAVQGDFEVRDLLQGLVHEVGVEGAQHGLRWGSGL